MLSVNEINLLQAQNEGLKKQNAELQKENTKLKTWLQDIKAIAEQRNYLNYGEALDDIIDLITKAESVEE